jgi:CRISPR system Cascade subunit CasB
VSVRTWEDELVERLTEFAKPDNPNRAVLAHLRRGLDRPLDYTLGRVGWLFHHVPESKDDMVLRNSALAAGLFAWVKGRCGQMQGINFGAAFGAGLSQDKKQQREKRFVDLLDADADELAYKLRQAITLIARNDDARLDWGLLIRNLGRWSHPDRWVQKDWARRFWAATEADIEVETIADNE